MEYSFLKEEDSPMLKLLELTEQEEDALPPYAPYRLAKVYHNAVAALAEEEENRRNWFDLILTCGECKVR